MPKFDLSQLLAERKADKGGMRPAYKALVNNNCATCGEWVGGDLVFVEMGDRTLCLDCFLVESPAPVRVARHTHQLVLPYLIKE